MQCSPPTSKNTLSQPLRKYWTPYAELQRRYTELLERPGHARRRLFSAFPDMKNPLHNNVLQELKEKYRRK